MTDQNQDPAGCPDADCPCDLTAEFEDVLRESVSFLQAPQAGPVPNAFLAVKATSSLFDAFMSLAKALGSQLSVYLPTLKPAVLKIYDERIAPLDIAFVPDPIEPMVDAVIRGVLEKGIDTMIAADLTFEAADRSTASRIVEMRAKLPA
jgi:hypothetical protein